MMKQFSVKELAKIIGAAPPRAGVSIAGVSTDSRTIQQGDCFFAIEGENFDGHNYLDQAFANGAVCAVVSKNFNCPGRQSQATDGSAVLQVPDTVRALGDFAREYRRQLDIKVVAITGSVGKTTTKEMIYQVLTRQGFRCHKAPVSFNNDIGLPLSLLGAEPEDEIVIVELGSNYPGEIAYLSRIALPDVALITNVYPAHLAGFGSIEVIIKEKVSISEGLREGGSLIINGRFSGLLQYCKSQRLEFITFDSSADCGQEAKNNSGDGFSSSFTINGTGVTVLLPGAGNIENALAAWSVCRSFGTSARQFAEAIETLPGLAMRLEPMQIGSLMILNDCYNANPASMKNALDCLANIGSALKRRLVFVCGDMMELGSESEKFHAALGQQVAEAKVELLLAAGEFARITVQAAKASGGYGLQAECSADTNSVCEGLEKFIEADDIILVKGSRDVGLEVVIEKLKEIFN